MDYSVIRLCFCLLVTTMLSIKAEEQSMVMSGNHSTGNNSVPSSPLQREGHDKDLEKVMFPVLVGFKLTGLAAATFAVLKIFVLQALLASKTALLGALALALKALYVYLRDKYWKSKASQVDHPSSGFTYTPYWPQWDWAAGNYPHPSPEDYHSEESDHLHPHPYWYPHHNDSFAVKADTVKLTTPPPKSEHKPYIARITETTFD